MEVGLGKKGFERGAVVGWNSEELGGVGELVGGFNFEEVPRASTLGEPKIFVEDVGFVKGLLWTFPNKELLVPVNPPRPKFTWPDRFIFEDFLFVPNNPPSSPRRLLPNRPPPSGYFPCFLSFDDFSSIQSILEALDILLLQKMNNCQNDKILVI